MNPPPLPLEGRRLQPDTSTPPFDDPCGGADDPIGLAIDLGAAEYPAWPWQIPSEKSYWQGLTEDVLPALSRSE